jgi:tetratricopeptide (TPR) repeat protein
MWAELYPEDIAAHSNLYQHYRWQSGELDKAVAEVETMLEIDPKRFNYWQTLGDLYLEQGDYSSSIEYYKMYAEKFPTKINALIPVGIVYQLQGDFENARTYYEKASTLEPDNVEVMDRLTDLHSRQGRFDEAYAGYQKALEKANTAQEKHIVYASLEDLFETQGQIRESIRYMHLRLKAMGEYNDPLNTMVAKIFAVQKYLSIGQADSAFSMTNTINFEPPFDAIKPLAFMNLYIKSGDLEKAREAIEGAKSFIEAFGGNWARRHLFRAQAELSEINGDLQEAVKHYNQVLKVRPRDDDVRIKLANSLRHAKEYNQAQDLLLSVLKRQPIHPKLNLELARLYMDMGDIENAKEYLNSALKIWQNADKDYESFQKALELQGKIAA